MVPLALDPNGARHAFGTIRATCLVLLVAMVKVLGDELFTILVLWLVYHFWTWLGWLCFFIPNEVPNAFFRLALVAKPASEMFSHVTKMGANLAKPNSHKAVFVIAWLLLALKHFGWVETNLHIAVSCMLLTYRILVASIWE